MKNFCVLVSNIMMLKDQKRFKALLSSKNIDAVFPQVDQFLSEDQLLSYSGIFDGILAGDDQISRKVLIQLLPKLKVISKWGTGLDSIDLDAANELGVPVYNSPGAFKHAVAEVALGYMIDLSRHISFTDRKVRQNEWVKPVGQGLVGKSLGIIGFGAIGQGIAKCAASFDMTLYAFDIKKPETEPLGVTLVPLPELLSKSDYVCLACNLSEQSRGMINKQSIALMKDGARIVNVARGPLVHESALIHALESGKISGAGLDVFETEPLAPDHPFKTMDNVILGSHNANNVLEVTEYVHQNTLNNLYKGLGIPVGM